MSIQAGFGSLGGAATDGLTPLVYENLTAFLDAETDVTESSNVVSQWDGQSANAIAFTVPSGHIGPDFESSSQNSLPGLSFEDPGSGNDRLRRKLSTGDNDLDNIWFGSGNKSLAFAGRWDRTTDQSGFNTASTIASKGIEHNQGWTLQIKPNGTLEFIHYMTNGSRFILAANGFYSASDLVLGYVRYSGGNSNGSASFRLFNGSDFVTVGTVTTASSSSKQSDASRDFVVGNTLKEGDTNINAPFEGPLFGLWVTRPANNAVDESYLARWIVS